MGSQERKDVYYGECHHIFSDDIISSDCIHRFFNVNIPTHNFYGRVIVCNEYFRLRVREYRYNSDGYRDKRSIDEVTKEIILDALKIDSIVFRNDTFGGYAFDGYSFGQKNNRDDIMRGVAYAICQRPYITLNVSLELAVNTLSDTSSSSYSYELRCSTYNRLNYLATRVLKLAKYKKYHNQVYQIMNKIMPYKHHYEYDVESKSLYNPHYKDLMVLLFEILTKNSVKCNQ